MVDPIKERVEINLDAPPRVTFCDELACPLDRLMSRAPRPKPKLWGWKYGSKTAVSTCDRAWQINRSTTVGTPNIRVPPEGLGIITLLTGDGR